MLGVSLWVGNVKGSVVCTASTGAITLEGYIENVQAKKKDRRLSPIAV